MAERGAAVALGDVAPAESTGEWMAELCRVQDRVAYHVVDVTDDDAVGRWVADVESILGPPTLIIPNAGLLGFQGGSAHAVSVHGAGVGGG